MNRIDIINLAAELADSILPDPGIIGQDEDATKAATDMVAHCEAEASANQETLGDVPSRRCNAEERKRTMNRIDIINLAAELADTWRSCASALLSG